MMAAFTAKCSHKCLQSNVAKIQISKHQIPFTFLIIIIILLAFKLLSIDINKPFWGHHDWNSVVYSNIARNYLRFGYIGTKFGQVTTVDFQKPQNSSYITHYPPLLPIFLSFTFKIFGISETSARLTIVAFSLFMVYFIYQIGREIHSKLMGIFAATSAIFLPIFLYFGKLPVHDTIVPPISTFGFWAYIKFIKERRNNYYYLLIGSLVIGGLINWSAFYITVALILHQFIYKNTKEIKFKIYALLPISITLFLIHLAHIKLLGVKSSSVFSNFLVRVNPYLTANEYGFTLIKYVIQELRFVKIYYTLPVFLGAIFFIFSFIYYFKKNRLDLVKSFIIVLFLYGLIQILFFQQLSFIHDYMIYYLLPFMVLSFAYSVFFIFNELKQKLVFPLILVLLLAFILFSQFKYVKTLLATSVNKRGYDVAKVINTNTKSGQSSFVTSNSYKEFQDVFISYYSDRQVEYGETLPQEFSLKYSLIIRPKDHDPLPPESKNFLDNNFPKYESDQFIWYKIN